MAINWANDGTIIMSHMSLSGATFCISSEAFTGPTRRGTLDMTGISYAVDCYGGWDY